MAQQVIYKNVGIADEATWGVSLSVTRYLPIKSSTVERVVNKTLVSDTTATNKGMDRITLLKNEIGGDINAFGSPKILHNFLKWVNGGPGVTSAIGTSAIQITYNQATNENFNSFEMVQDRNNAQETFVGLRGTKLQLKASDNILDATLSVFGKQRLTGVSVVDRVGETFKPLTFADMTITLAGATYQNAVTLLSSEWTLEYNNNMERTHLSGDETAARLDAKVPTLTGTIKIFHVGNSYVDATYGLSDFYLRFEGIPDSSTGLIAGVTPTYLRIDIPRVEITKNTRNYEADKLAVETLTFDAMFDPGISALWKPQLVTGFDIEA